VRDLAAVGVRVELDAHPDVSVARLVDWELHGVPIRVELGLATSPRTGCRSPSARGRKVEHGLDELASVMPAILAAEQVELVRQATELRDRLTRTVQTIEEAREQAREGAARLPWAALRPAGEQRLLDDGISIAAWSARRRRARGRARRSHRSRTRRGGRLHLVVEVRRASSG